VTLKVPAAMHPFPYSSKRGSGTPLRPGRTANTLPESE
jgi:hypothetical protein